MQIFSAIEVNDQKSFRIFSSKKIITEAYYHSIHSMLNPNFYICKFVKKISECRIMHNRLNMLCYTSKNVSALIFSFKKLLRNF